MSINKRGQDLSITTLVLIVLGIIVLVFIIIGFTLGWGYIFDKINILPGQSLETATQSCKIAAQQSLRIDYCKEFKEVKISGVTQFVNCEYSDIKVSLNAEGVESLDCNSFKGTPPVDNKLVKEECASLIVAGKKATTLVNGAACSSVITACTDLGGSDLASKVECLSTEKRVSVGTLNCCVPN